MKALSDGLLVAWKIAAIETGLNKNQFIEKEQILIGICSLEKVIVSRRLSMKFNNKELQEIKYEFELIQKLLSKYKLDATNLRRKLRKDYGQGNYKHTEKVIHRSEDCKVFFKRAELLAENSDKVRCLHLFAAILENPEDVIKEILKERDIKPKEMQKKALFFARISQKNNDIDSYII
jgi:ATP-dependent Clp protease ATP-binding subunit ClpC